MADPTLRILSLFAGIGGLDLGVRAGLDRVGVASRHVGFVEREAFAVACLVAAMERGELDRAPVWCGDVERLPVPAADLVIAGFPCPPVSCAGKRLGTADERWLWPEVVRVVQDSGAALVFLENVRGLLTANDGAAFGEVLSDLARLGFDAEWATFTAAEVGAPHRRERVFVLAHHQRRRLGERTDAAAPVAAGWSGAREPPRGDILLADRADGGLGEPGREEGDGEPAGGSRVALAHREHAGQRGQREGHDGPRSTDAPGNHADGCDPRMGDAEGHHGRRELEARGTRRGRAGLAGAGRDVGDGDGDGPQGQHEAGAAPRAVVGNRDVADADVGEQPQEREGDEPRGELARRRRAEVAAGAGAAGGDHWPGRWPPGPGDRARWANILAADPGLAPAVVADVRRVADGVSPRVDRLRALGNAVVPDCAGRAFVELWRRVTA